ncbi:SET domain-containing protein [Cladophialophora immunda]|nr:SET domain-containing protein [Cladophialophora immunda]
MNFHYGSPGGHGGYTARSFCLQTQFDQTKDHVKPTDRIVIELSDSEDETPSIPLPKRQKSQTPAADGPEPRRVLPQSRPQSQDAKTYRHATPPASAASRAQQQDGPSKSTPKRSPWKKLSRYSLSNDAFADLRSESPSPSDAPEQEQITSSFPTRTRVRSETHGSSSVFDHVKAGGPSTKRIPSSLEPRIHATRPRRDEIDRPKRVTRSDRGSVVRSEERKRSASSQGKDTLSRHIRTGKSSSLNRFSIDIRRPTSDTDVATSQQGRKRLPKIEVVIDSQRKDLLRQFQAPLPKSRAQLSAEKNAVLAQLEQSTKLAHEKPELVERHFGTTGFSAVFSVDEDVEFMRGAASKKKKKANRNNIKLEIDSLCVPLDQLSLKTSFIHPARTARKILISRFEERLNPPLTFANDINDRRLPGKFQFIDHYIISPKVKMAPPSTNSGCDCRNCALSTCQCLTKEVDGRETQVEIYARRPDGIVVLSDDYINQALGDGNERQEITECNEHCGCGDDCWNRVVCKGRTIPLEVFQTKNCGFGVRSSKDIVKGQFIQRYLGEVITDPELEQREDAAEEQQPSYVYTLDWFGNKEPYYVDGEYFGSAMRFVNHSCNPNTLCVTVQTHRKDKRVYDLAFFATKDIKAGEEICVSYKNDGSSDVEQISEDLVKCQCGEDNCRGILWKPSKKTRRRRRRQE